MSQPLNDVGKFLKRLQKGTEPKIELVLGIALYVMFTFVITKTLDVWLDRFFDEIEKASNNLINPENKLWVFIQVTIQLAASVVLSYMIIKLVHHFLINVNRVAPIGFGIFDRTSAGKIIFASIMFFTQDNLKAKLKTLIPNIR